MAAGEDQPEAIILDLLVVTLLVITRGLVDVRLVDLRVVEQRFRVEGEILLCLVEAGAPAHAIDGLEACRRNQPGPRFVRNARLEPGIERGSERLVHGLFGEIQISEEAHERRQHPARLRAVESVNGLSELFGRRRWH